MSRVAIYWLTMHHEVQAIIETLRPIVARHKGDIELVDVNEGTGVVQVRLTGACEGCPLAGLTLKAGIEAELMAKVSGVKEVVAV